MYNNIQQHLTIYKKYNNFFYFFLSFFILFFKKGFVHKDSATLGLE